MADLGSLSRFRLADTTIITDKPQAARSAARMSAADGSEAIDLSRNTPDLRGRRTAPGELLAARVI
ncbi:hypothetical protein GCM10011588_29130 [Nocardia jinanensis]|uniref:Uncharacterized protein n=1 Tax=Nocardia jinanensis TaxID=382504 RepID=A0A917VTF5_9NOCA|nr:hypothetical protein GCM10011588_29130 [Nocardia jinanensis]